MVVVFLEIFYRILLPTLTIMSFGFALGKRMKIDVRPFTQVILYLLSPSLIFTSLARSTLSLIDSGNIVAVAVAVFLLLTAASFGLSKALRYEKQLASAFVLATIFPNAGNYGLPLNLLAFGQAGLERAVVFFIVSSFLTFTFGVFLASQGHHGLGASLRNIARLPLLYAMAFGVAVRLTNITLPEPVFLAVSLTGQAAIPSMLIVLGFELAQMTGQTAHKNIAAAGLAGFVKLLLAPVIAFVAATALGLEGLTQKVSILQASMPTAVITTILATQFGSDYDFVSSVVFITTLASSISLTVLLALLR